VILDAKIEDAEDEVADSEKDPLFTIFGEAARGFGRSDKKEEASF
jgi:hypothetical protein